MRDQVVDFVRRWSEATEIVVGRFIHWLGVMASKFVDWRERYGYVNEHPTGATTGKIAVTTKGGSATSATSFTVN